MPPKLASQRFSLFSQPLTASGGDGKPKMLHGIASSTVRDLHGDVMELSALQDMEAQANSGLTIFGNHEYRVPDDIYGSVDKAWLVESNQIDKETGSRIWHLHYDIIINEENEQAVKSWRTFKSNPKIRMGLSIGAMIPADGWEWDPKAEGYIIRHVQLLETSIVGIPANTESWLISGVLALKSAITKAQQKVKLSAPELQLNSDGSYDIHGSIEGLLSNRAPDVTTFSGSTVVAKMGGCTDCGHSAGCDCTDCDCTNSYHTGSQTTSVEPPMQLEAMEGEPASHATCETCGYEQDGLFAEGICPHCKSAGPFLATKDDGNTASSGGGSGDADSKSDAPLQRQDVYQHDHPHAHSHGGEHTHKKGDVDHSHDHTHIHGHQHSHGDENDHNHDEKMNQPDHNHDHADSGGDHPHEAPSSGAPADTNAVEVPLTEAKVTVIEIDTDDGATDSDAGSEGGESTGDDASSQEASANPMSDPGNDDAGEPPLGDPTRSENPDLVATAAHAADFARVAEALVEQTKAREAAERRVLELTSELETAKREREVALTQAGEAVLMAKRIVEEVGNTPMGRRAVGSPDVQRDLDDLAGIYDPEVLQVLRER